MRAVKEVLGEKAYRIKFAYAFVTMFVIAAFLMNFVSVFSLVQGKIVFTEVVNFDSLVFLIAFSFLSAISMTLHLYRVEKFSSGIGKGGVGIAGAFLGIFTSACTICYPLVLSLIGIPAALVVLPFGGLEVQAASIALLLMSVFFISRSIERGKCK